MAEDFRAQIKLELDQSSVQKVKSQIDSITKEDKPIKINFDNSSGKKISDVTSKFEKLMQTVKEMKSLNIKLNGLDSNKNAKQISEITNQLNTLNSKYKSITKSIGNPGNLSTKQWDKLNNVAREYINTINILDAKKIDTANISDATSKFKILYNTAKEISKTSLKIESLDESKNTEQISQLKNSLSGLESEYHSVMQSLGGATNLPAQQLEKLNAIAQQTKERLAQIDASKLSAEAKRLSDIQIKIDNKTIDAQIADIESKFRSLAKTSDTAAGDINKLKSTLSNIKLNVGTGTNTSSVIAQYSQLESGIKKLRNEYSILKNEGGTFSSGGGMFNFIKNATGFMGTYQIVSSIFNQFKNGVQFVKELDDALTNVSYTVDLTDSKLESIGSSSLQMAEDFKTSATTVLQAVTLYANANETAESILNKSQTAVELSNVTGMSGTDSAKMLQSIMNQFDLTEDDLTYISDTVQSVSQNMAYDFSSGIQEIADGINVSGQMAQSAGLDLSQYASILGVVIEKTGLAGSQIGNAFKTIISRVTKASAVAGTSQDDISAAETSLRGVGIQVRSSSGNFRDFGDTIGELAGKWDSLSDVEQSNISYNLAGIRQSNVLKTLLKNYDEYVDILNKADTAQGTTAANQEKYADSISGHLGGLTAAAQKMWADLIDSGSAKKFIDIATSIVSALDAVGSKINWAAVGFTTFGLVAKSAFSVISKTKVFKSVVSGLKEIVSSATPVTTAFKTIKSSISPLTGTIIGVGIAIAAFSAIYDKLYTSVQEKQDIFDAASSDYDNTASSLDDVNSKISETKDRISELQKISNSGTITLSEKNELDQLKETNTELQKEKTYLEALKKQKTQVKETAAVNLATSVVEDDSSKYEYEPGDARYWAEQHDTTGTSDFSRTDVALKNEISAYNKVEERQKKIKDRSSSEYKENAKNLEEMESNMVDLASNAQKYESNLTGSTKESKKIKTDYQDALDTYTAFIDKESGKTQNQILQEGLADGGAISDASSDLKDLADQGNLTDTSLKKLCDKYPRLSSFMDANGLSAQNIVEYYNSIAGTAKETTADIIALGTALSESQIFFKNGYTNAFNYGSTGIDSTTKDALDNEYQDLDGYENLYSNTGTGVSVNQDVLYSLQSQSEKIQKSKYSDTLNELSGKYKKAKKELSGLVIGTDDYNKKLAEANGYKEQIEEVSTLASEYDGLTSAYNKWVQAKSGGEEGDKYDSVASQISSSDKLLKEGLTGTNEFHTSAQLLSNKDLSDASIEDQIKAYKNGRKVVKEYFTDNIDGVDTFSKKLEKMNMVSEENGVKTYTIDVEKMAKELGVSTDLVEMLGEKMRDYGYNVDMTGANDSIKHATDILGEYGNNYDILYEKAQKAQDELNKSGWDFNIDTNDLDSIDSQITNVSRLIDENFRGKDGEIDLSVEGASDAVAILQILTIKKQEATAPAIMTVETDGLPDAQKDVISTLQKLQQATNKKEIVMAVGTKVDQKSANKEVSSLVSKIKEMSSNSDSNKILLELGIDATSEETIISSLQKINPEILATLGIKVDDSEEKKYKKKDHNVKGEVKYHLNASEEKKYKKKDHNVKGEVKYHLNASNVYSWKVPTKYGTIIYYKYTKDKGELERRQALGARQRRSGKAQGTAYVRGTAFKNGSWGTKSSGKALGGELGTELLIRDGKFTTIGDNGAEFFNYKKDDIIFNAAQTEELFKYGGLSGVRPRGTIVGYSSGTAFAEGNAFAKGKAFKSGTSRTKLFEKFQDWFSRIFDWVEIKLKKLSDKADFYITRAKTQADHNDYKAARSSYVKGMSAIKSEIRENASAADVYTSNSKNVLSKAMANKVISKKTAKTIAERVSNGSMRLTDYSERVQEVIKDYQNLKDKAYDCKNAIDDLSSSIREYTSALAETYTEKAKVSIENIDNNTDILKNKSDSIYPSSLNNISLRQSLLNDQASNIKGKQGVYKSAYTSVTNQVEYVGRRINSLSTKKVSKSYLKYFKSAKDAAKRKKKIPESLMAEVLVAYKKTTNSTARTNLYKLYYYCSRWNDELDAQVEAKYNKDLYDSTVAQSLADIGKESFDSYDTYYSNQINKIESGMTSTKAIQQIKETKGAKLTKSDYESLLSQNGSGISTYQTEISKLKESISYNLSKKYWTTSSEEYQNALDKISDYENKLYDCENAQEEYNNSIAQLPIDTLESTLDLLDSIANLNKSYSDLKESMGEDLDESDYLQQISDLNNEIEKYTEEAGAYWDYYLQAMNSSDQAIYGKPSDEWLTEYDDMLSKINQAKSDIEGIKDDMRDDVFWRTFDRMHDSAKQAADVISGISDLIDDDMLYDSNGKITDFGKSKIAALVKEYEVAEQEVENYNSDIDNLNKLYNEGYYTLDEYNDKLSDLNSGVLSSAKDMKSAMDDITSMYKEMEQSEIDNLKKVIDARSEAIKKKKEYYDYDKTIKSKSKDIVSLQAQIAALENISGEEAQSKRATLKEQLSTSQDELNDTVEDHIVNISQDALTDLGSTIDDTFNEKWDYIGENLDNIIDIMSNANELTVHSSDAINKSLNKILSYYGLNQASNIPISNITGYASGTSNAIKGIHLFDETGLGSEMIVTEDGILKQFDGGEYVFSDQEVKSLANLANISNSDLINKLKSSNNSSVDIVQNSYPSVNIDQHYDALLNVSGNVDSTVISDLKEFTNDLLEKSYDYTSKNIMKNYYRSGGRRIAR